MKQKILIVLIFACINCKAQHKNSMIVNLDMMYNRGYFHSTELPQYGIKYNRYINENTFIGFGIEKWTNNKNFFLYSKIEIYGTPEESIGKLISRDNYQFVNFDITRILFETNYFGEFSGGIGISYSWGKNTFVDTAWTSPTPPYDVEVKEYHTSPGRYFGIYPVINYNYPFIKKRFVIGLHFIARKYFGLEAAQLNWGAHLGINF